MITGWCKIPVTLRTSRGGRRDRDLATRGVKVQVGMEVSGQARWFERLLVELSLELWIGDAAEIRAKRVRKKEDLT